jgi:hypothetical protein
MNNMNVQCSYICATDQTADVRGSTLRSLTIQGDVKMPVFYILVILVACILILLLSALYKPIGKFIHRIFKDAKDNALEEDKTKQNRSEST